MKMTVDFNEYVLADYLLYLDSLTDIDFRLRETKRIAEIILDSGDSPTLEPKDFAWASHVLRNM
jgi:hypothetical protein